MTSAAFLVRIDALSDPESRGFDPDGSGADTIFVVRHGGTVRGWQNRCPHDGESPMAWRKDAYLNADGSRIVCYAHGAQFDPATGVCTLGPCMGQSLMPVALEVTQDGEVRVVKTKT